MLHNHSLSAESTAGAKFDIITLRIYYGFCFMHLKYSVTENPVQIVYLQHDVIFFNLHESLHEAHNNKLSTWLVCIFASLENLYHKTFAIVLLMQNTTGYILHFHAV